MSSLSLARFSLKWCMAATFFFQFFLAIFFPKWQVGGIIPFLIIVSYQKKYLETLWMSLFAGLFLDLLEPSLRFGFFAANFALVMAFVYRCQQSFFADRLLTLPCMSAFFSLCYSASSLLLWYVIERKRFSLGHFFSYSFFLTLFSAGFAFLIFTLPSFYFCRQGRLKRHHFMQRRQRL